MDLDRTRGVAEPWAGPAEALRDMLRFVGARARRRTVEPTVRRTVWLLG